MRWNSMVAVVFGILTMTDDASLNAATATPAAPMLAVTFWGVTKWLLLIVVFLVWLARRSGNRSSRAQGHQAWRPPAQPAAPAANRHSSVGKNDAQGRIGAGADAGKVVTVDEVQQVLRSAAVRPKGLPK